MAAVDTMRCACRGVSTRNRRTRAATRGAITTPVAMTAGTAAMITTAATCSATAAPTMLTAAAPTMLTAATTSAAATSLSTAAPTMSLRDRGMQRLMAKQNQR